jgi:hypothetical protein
MVVQLLYFPDCPNVASARSALREALGRLADPPPVAEVDVTNPTSPAHLRSWGSPTILVDGVDVAGEQPTESCCRLYREGERRGAPSVILIEAALERARRASTP